MQLWTLGVRANIQTAGCTNLTEPVSISTPDNIESITIHFMTAKLIDRWVYATPKKHSQTNWSHQRTFLVSNPAHSAVPLFSCIYRTLFSGYYSKLLNYCLLSHSFLESSPSIGLDVFGWKQSHSICNLFYQTPVSSLTCPFISSICVSIHLPLQINLYSAQQTYRCNNYQMTPLFLSCVTIDKRIYTTMMLCYASRSCFCWISRCTFRW